MLRTRKGTSDQSDHRFLPSIVQEWPNRARNLAGCLIWIKKGRLRSGNLPVELPTRFEQVIKLKTAKECDRTLVTDEAAVRRMVQSACTIARASARDGRYLAKNMKGRLRWNGIQGRFWLVHWPFSPLA